MNDTRDANPYDDELSAELRGQEYTAELPEVEAACNEHDLHDLFSFAGRLFRMRAQIETFGQIPPWMLPLTRWEAIGLVVLADEINRFEQNEIRRESDKLKEKRWPTSR